MAWLPWAALALLGLLLLLTLLVVNAIDDDGPDGASGDTLGQSGSDGSGINGQDGNGRPAGAEGAGGAVAAPPAPQLRVGQDDLLAQTGGSLATRSGQPVTGTALVESVVSDEGFWVGSSPASRVFVFLTPQARQSSGESGFQVAAGQTVQLDGVLAALNDFAESASGVTDEEGLAQLRQQGGFVQARSVRLS